MISEVDKVKQLLRVDFGETDGYGDPNLEKYFFDDDYWRKIVEQPVFYVIGRKGTGKSSIYRMIEENGNKYGNFIVNKDFGDFPFEKLLALDDEAYSKPNQYQSIWKNLLLNIFATKIAEIDAPGNLHHEKLVKYVNECLGDTVELHKELVNFTYKIAGGLAFKGMGINGEKQKGISLGNGSNNITNINASLYKLVLDFLMSYEGEAKFIIQFDRLDDNYNQYQNLDEYYQAIISLFKTVYQINQGFRARKINNSKIILYLRSDIYSALSDKDAESARWDDFKSDINWAIINRDDWGNPKLLQLIDKRIKASLTEMGEEASFRCLLNKSKINLKTSEGELLDVFQYIVERTMHRPRDLVKFCLCIQNEIKETNKLYFRTIKNAEKNYTHWLLKSEIANEINPVLKKVEPVYDLLKLMGRRPFSLAEFKERYKSVKGINMEAEELAYYLYDIAVFSNVGKGEYRSILRNKGKLDRNMKIIIHSGIWSGLQV